MPLVLRQSLYSSFDPLRRIYHIPHFRLAPLPVFMGGSIFVRGMHLHRLILLGIDELNRDGQFAAACVPGTQIFRVRPQNLRKRKPILFSAHYKGWLIRVGSALPGIRQRV